MPWEPDGITYRYSPPLELDIAQDNMRFLSLTSPSNRARFLEEYFFFESLSAPVYAINSFRDKAFLEMIGIVKRNKMLQPLCYRKANPNIHYINGYYPPTIRDIDLARFRYYDNRIENLENRLKTIENALTDAGDKISNNWSSNLFDASGGDANDSAEV